MAFAVRMTLLSLGDTCPSIHSAIDPTIHPPIYCYVDIDICISTALYFFL